MRNPPVAWRFRIDACPHPRHATSRWQLPGRDVNAIAADGAWWISLLHAGDGPYTGGDQRIWDDPQGAVAFVRAGPQHSDVVPVALGNAVASLYADHRTPPEEVAELHGGTGYFADAARVCRWLAAVDGPERQRRLALGISPAQYRAVLTTDGDKRAAAELVTEQIPVAEAADGHQVVDGLLHAVTPRVSEEARTRLVLLTSEIVCDPRTSDWWRARLVRGLIDSRLSADSPSETLTACALRVVTNDRLDPRLLDHAETLLDGDAPVLG